MSEPKFTPGPWEASLEAARFVIQHTPEHGMGKRALAYTGGSEPANPFNARLIAAAPTLFTKVAIAATIFREYERLHANKGTVDGDAKARRNAQYAEEMEAALAAAQGIEAPSGDETRSGSAVGESPVGEADAPKGPHNG